MMIIIYHPIFEKSTILFKKSRYFTKKLQIKRNSKLLCILMGACSLFLNAKSIKNKTYVNKF